MTWQAAIRWTSGTNRSRVVPLQQLPRRSVVDVLGKVAKRNQTNSTLAGLAYLRLSRRRGLVSMRSAAYQAIPGCRSPESNRTPRPAE